LFLFLGERSTKKNTPAFGVGVPPPPPPGEGMMRNASNREHRGLSIAAVKSRILVIIS